jgi:hypothetical protein
MVFTTYLIPSLSHKKIQINLSLVHEIRVDVTTEPHRNEIGFKSVTFNNEGFVSYGD